MLSHTENSKSAEPDEAAQIELPYLDKPCLQIQLFSFFGTYKVNSAQVPASVSLSFWRDRL